MPGGLQQRSPGSRANRTSHSKSCLPAPAANAHEVRWATRRRSIWRRRANAGLLAPCVQPAREILAQRTWAHVARDGAHNPDAELRDVESIASSASDQNPASYSSSVAISGSSDVFRFDSSTYLFPQRLTDPIGMTTNHIGQPLDEATQKLAGGCGWTCTTDLSITRAAVAH